MAHSPGWPHNLSGPACPLRFGTGAAQQKKAQQRQGRDRRVVVAVADQLVEQQRVPGIEQHARPRYTRAPRA